MGAGPKRRCETVCEPDFFESYTKYPWACSRSSAPRILMVFLFAPTVPSEPSPKKTARTVSGGSMSSAGSYGRLVPLTSSVIPMVNRDLGLSPASSASTPATMPGVNSLDDSP